MVLVVAISNRPLICGTLLKSVGTVDVKSFARLVDNDCNRLGRKINQIRTKYKFN
jgi:hypothetical protein